MYTRILDQYLVPFIRGVCPTGLCKTMILSTPHVMHKHFFQKSLLTGGKLHQRSPDANPIENLRHELKASAPVRTRIMSAL